MIEAINQTLLNAWAACPESVRRRWIEGERIPPGISARIGTGVHKGAEVNHRAKMATGQDEPLDVIQDAARDGYVSAVRDGGVFFSPEEIPGAKTALSNGVDVVVSLARIYREELAPLIRPVMAEEKIYAEVEGLPLPFVGTLDVLDESGWLPDLKTAERRWSQDKADSSLQGTLYPFLVASRTGRWPNRISFEVFVRSGGGAHQSVETARRPEDIRPVVARAALMLRMIDAGLFPPAEPGHWKCSPKWCGYWWTCPYIPAHRKTLPKRSS